MGGLPPSRTAVRFLQPSGQYQRVLYGGFAISTGEVNLKESVAVFCLHQYRVCHFIFPFLNERADWDFPTCPSLNSFMASPFSPAQRWEPDLPQGVNCFLRPLPFAALSSGRLVFVVGFSGLGVALIYARPLPSLAQGVAFVTGLLHNNSPLLEIFSSLYRRWELELYKPRN